MKKYIFLLILTANNSFGQNFFKLRGTLFNLDEEYITFTLYKNWVEEPVEYKLKLTADKSFFLDIPLDEIAYCDIDFGENSLYTLKIEPQDKIEIKLDMRDFYNSITLEGNGSSKWKYYLERKKIFELDKDWEFELDKLKKISRKGFLDLTTYLSNEELNLLTKYKEEVSETFFSLQRADIYGKISNYELQYLVSRKLFNQSEFERFQLKTFNPEIQNKSFEFSSFLDNLIDNHNTLSLKYEGDRLMELETFKAYFEKLDYINKASIDRILALKIMNYLDVDGITEPIKLLVVNYKDFSKNKIYVNAVMNKFSALKNLTIGSTAKNFILPDAKGNLISLKDFRGKNILLSFYSSWCGPCVNDLNYLSIIDNYFKPNGDFICVSIGIDSKSDFINFIEENNIQSINLHAAENSDIKKDYAIESVPNYYLIDKSGMIMAERVVVPSEDEGRGLIQQIDRLLYKK